MKIITTGKQQAFDGEESKEKQPNPRTESAKIQNSDQPIVVIDKEHNLSTTSHSQPFEEEEPKEKKEKMETESETLTVERIGKRRRLSQKLKSFLSLES